MTELPTSKFMMMIGMTMMKRMKKKTETIFSFVPLICPSTSASKKSSELISPTVITPTLTEGRGKGGGGTSGGRREAIEEVECTIPCLEAEVVRR